MFADDLLLFCQATRAEGETIVEILQIYERASGQSVNLKSPQFTLAATPQKARKVRFWKFWE